MRLAARLLAIGALLATAAPAAAQPDRATFAVHGTVFDSVARAPLAGATVQVAATTGTAAPKTAVTDARGQYRVDSLDSGTYIVGFYHDALTLYGLDAPTRAVALGGAVEPSADLYIPSSGTIRSLRCGDFDPQAPGMLVGTVRDALTRATVPGATLHVSWGAIATDSSRYRVTTERREATINDDGTFFACRVPLDAALDLDVGAPGHRSLKGPVVVVPNGGIGRLEVLLTDSTEYTGPAIVRGQVLRESGKAVTSGRVLIPTLGREAPVQDGAFVIANLPLGSWIAETRVIGVEPRTVVVTAADSAPDAAVITVSNTPQRLEVVSIVGTPDRNTYKLQEVLMRKRIGGATVFMPGSPALRSATFTTDVFKEARGFTYEGPTKITGRRVALGGIAKCAGTGVFVNNLKQPEGFTGLDALVTPDDVLAIEAYADINFAPVQYRGLAIGRRQGEPSPCAVVLVWTKSP